MISKLKYFLKNLTGATPVEYAAIVGLVAFGIVVGARQMGTNLDDFFERTATTLSNLVSLTTQSLGGPTTQFASSATGNFLIGVTQVADAQNFEPYQFVEGVNSRTEYIQWLDSENGARPGLDGNTPSHRVENALNDLSVIYGTDMTQDLLVYGSGISDAELSQILDEVDNRRAAI